MTGTRVPLFRCDLCEQLLDGYAAVGRHLVLMHPSTRVVREIERPAPKVRQDDRETSGTLQPHH